MCYSKETEWIKASGKGTVYTYAVYHQVFHPSFEKDIPYVTAIIKLAARSTATCRSKLPGRMSMKLSVCLNLSLIPEKIVCDIK
jgi:uncharacterized OB-fold protein